MKRDTINIPRPDIWYIWIVSYYEDCLIDMAETEAEADIMVKHYQAFENSIVYKAHAKDGYRHFEMKYDKEYY